MSVQNADRQLALVTGASTGLGRSIALELASRRIDVVLVARSQEKLREVASLCESHDVRAHVLPADLGQPDGVAQLVDTVTERFDTLDILVNNAGIASHGPFEDQELSNILQIIDLNVRAFTELTHRLLGTLVASRGRILNVASVAGLQPSPLFLPYSATKAYIIMLSDALQHELRPHGVSVTTFCPSSMSTPFLEKTGMNRSRAFTLLPVQTPDAAAKVAVKATISRRAFVIPGLFNKLLAASIAFTPRFLQKASVGYLLGNTSRK